MADEELEKERKLFAVAPREFSGSAFLFARLSCLARPKPLGLGTHENEPTFAQKSGPADWRAPTVSCVVVLVANESWALAPCQDRSRRRRWPKASLYRGPAPNQTRPPTATFAGACPPGYAARPCKGPGSEN